MLIKFFITASLKYLHWKARRGDAVAQSDLGMMYYHGKIVKKDVHEGLRWLRKAAEQGFAEAQCNLGTMYESGDIIPFSLGNLNENFSNEEEGEKDDQEAVSWYRKAAEQGLAGAQNNLSLMYYLGKGVEKNQREAYIWLLIAKANGGERADITLQELPWQLTFLDIQSAKDEAARRIAKIEARRKR